MANIIFTEPIKQYIYKNAEGKTNAEMAEELNNVFNTSFTCMQVKGFKSRDKTIIKKKRSKPFQYTEEMKDFLIKNIPGTYNSELVKKFEEKFNTAITVHQIKWFKQTHGVKSGIDPRFKVGQPSAGPYKKGECAPGCEKGWFKKGQAPKTAYPIGAKRIQNGYVQIKTGKNKWEYEKYLVWEAVHGPVPEGYVLIPLDGDKLNSNIDNLAIISNTEALIMSKDGLYFDDAELTKTGTLIAKNIDRCNKLKKIKRKVQ